MSLRRGRFRVACALAGIWSPSAELQEKPGAPEPKLTVTLERESFVSDDYGMVHLWIANPSSATLTRVRLHFDAPDFLRLGTLDQRECAASGNEARLADVGPRAVLSWSGCIRTTEGIDEGDFKVLFLIQYAWAEGDASPRGSGEGYVAAERTLRLGLLGNEMIAGVSLRLVSLILPGLLFFMLLRWFKVLPAELNATETTMLSVLLSTFLVAAASRLFPSDLARSSDLRLWSLCGAAMALALVGVAGVRFRAKRRASLEEWPLVTPTDDAAKVLERLLATRGMPGQPTTVTLRSGERFVGSLSGRSKAGEHILLGWFELDSGGDAALRRRLDSLLSKRDFPGLFAEVRAHAMTPQVRDMIRRFDGSGLQPTANPFQLFAEADVMRVVREPVMHAPAGGPLTLV